MTQTIPNHHKVQTNRSQPRNRHLLSACCFLSWATSVVLGVNAVQAASPANRPSPSAEALSDTIWFDAEDGSVIPVEVKPRQDDSFNRNSRWLPKAKRVQDSAGTSTANGTTNTITGNGWFGTGLTTGNLLGWVLIIAFVVVAALVLMYALSKTEIDLAAGPAGRQRGGKRDHDEQTLERIKQLPPELRRTDVNLRDEAQRLMSQGDYKQAIILLFAHQLLYLDRAGYLRLNRGKTNRLYVRETRASDRQIGFWLQATVTAFERSYFGRHSIQSDDFSQLWTDNLALEQAVQKRQEVAL